MKPLQRYFWTPDQMTIMPSGRWVKYEDVQAYIQELIETLSIGWNVQLISGGAANDDSSNKGSPSD